MKPDHQTDLSMNIQTDPSMNTQTDPSENIQTEPSMNIQSDLFKDAMSSNWDSVVKRYKDPLARKAKITRAEDTVLHFAVSSGRTDIVKTLFHMLVEEKRVDNYHYNILKLENEKGNTALHLAASLGMTEVCRMMAKECPELVVDARNKNGETPLFLSAFHGKKYSFFALRYHAIESTGLRLRRDALSYCRRNDGNNILHCAIRGEYFGLAYEIIDLYPELVNYMNTRGESPLHILAHKPYVFESGSRLGLFDKLIYYCTFVDLLKVKYEQKKEDTSDILVDLEEGNGKIPPNYKTFLDSIKFLKNILKATEQISSWQLPKSYETCYNVFKLVMKFLLVILGIEGSSIMMAAIGDAKEMLDNVLDTFSMKVQDMNSSNIVVLGMDTTTSSTEPEGATALLVAAKKGITEMVEAILEKFPVAVQDVDRNEKNIVLLAVEHRQPHIYKLMLEKNIMKETILGKVDKDGNSALHLASTLGHNRPWIIPGAALQMQWEIKWFKYVKKSNDKHEFFRQYNDRGQTAREVFTRTHEKLVKDGGTWLTNTSQSCSVVAALIATVAFASATTVPGGINEQSGFPTLEGQPAFQMFAISALVALCFSVTSLIMFLSILTSRYQEWDFEYDLPVKLIFGLTSLFLSIAAMLVSFCAGHFFVIEKKLKFAAYPIYAVMCLPVSFFAMAQFPLYVDLIKATFAHVPERIEKVRDF